MSAFSLLCGLLVSWQCLKEEGGEKEGAVGVGGQGQSARALGPDRVAVAPVGWQGQEARQICFHVWVNLEISCSL